MMTPRRRRQFGPILLVVIGVSIMLAGVGLHWWYEYRGLSHRLEWIPQLIGASIAFAGFYAMDSKRARDGGGFLVDSGVKVIAILRGKEAGRRAGDAVIVTAPVDPTPLDDNDIPPLAPGNDVRN